MTSSVWIERETIRKECWISTSARCSCAHVPWDRIGGPRCIFPRAGQSATPNSCGRPCPSHEANENMYALAMQKMERWFSPAETWVNQQNGRLSRKNIYKEILPSGNQRPRKSPLVPFGKSRAHHLSAMDLFLACSCHVGFPQRLQVVPLQLRHPDIELSTLRL